MSLLAICIFIYSIWFVKFAEINIKLPFLDFPVFIGEILLFICILLFVGHVNANKLKFESWHNVIIALVIWLSVKALHGYFTNGPLALRHSALFYYSSFAFLTFYLFDKKFLNKTLGLAAFVLLLFCAKVFREDVQRFYKLLYLIISIIAVKHVDSRWLKWTLAALLLLFFPFVDLVTGPKAHLLAFIISLAFIMYFLVIKFLQTRFKYVVVAVMLVLLLAGIGKFGFNKVEAFLQVPKMVKALQEEERGIQERRKNFQFREIQPKLYNPEHRKAEELYLPFFSTRMEEYLGCRINSMIETGGHTDKCRTSDKIDPPKRSQAGLTESERKRQEASTAFAKSVTQKLSKNNQAFGEKIDQDIYITLEKNPELVKEGKDTLEAKFKEDIAKFVEEQDSLLDEIISAEVKKFQASDPNADPEQLKEMLKIEVKNNLRVLYSSMMRRALDLRVPPDTNDVVEVEQVSFLFRYLIWRDMIDDIIAERAVLGINMGKPQRSMRLEIVESAREEWSRDGWISPHNSWLHMIYRGGIVGLFIVLAVFWLFGRFVKSFVRARSIEGLLLASVTLYWLVIAFFSVFLELPYYAIPFWVLFGILARLSLEVSKQKN